MRSLWARPKVITLTGYFFSDLQYTGHVKCDYIKRLITLTSNNIKMLFSITHQNFTKKIIKIYINYLQKNVQKFYSRQQNIRINLLCCRMHSWEIKAFEKIIFNWFWTNDPGVNSIPTKLGPTSLVCTTRKFARLLPYSR
jgi:hypothetical protein